MAHPFLHFKTITRHRHRVIVNCFHAGIFWQGLGHDLSKYAPIEFIPGAKYYQGHRSPNEKEREVNGCSQAWMHHKGRNRHHFEYWTDYVPQTRQLEPMLMPDKYIVEMFCDRVAASQIYYGDDYTVDTPLNYFLRSKDTRKIHPVVGAKIEYLLRYLAEHGDKETFALIRRTRKTGLPTE